MDVNFDYPCLQRQVLSSSYHQFGILQRLNVIGRIERRARRETRNEDVAPLRARVVSISTCVREIKAARCGRADLRAKDSGMNNRECSSRYRERDADINRYRASSLPLVSSFASRDALEPASLASDIASAPSQKRPWSSR